VLASCLICLSSYDILRLLRIRAQDGGKALKVKVLEEDGQRDQTVLLDANTALNIAFFPPLFFFSALFYTDVMSTLVVLLSYSVLLRKSSTSGNLSDNLATIAIGLLALLFRQTNIFWVAVFPAALAVVAALKADASPAKSPEAATIRAILEDSWNFGIIHDSAVQDAAFQGIRNSCNSVTSLVLTTTRLCTVVLNHCACSIETASINIEGRFSIHHLARPLCWLCALEWKRCPR
jgi:alpha-1,2-glucosyltransferase